VFGLNSRRRKERVQREDQSSAENATEKKPGIGTNSTAALALPEDAARCRLQMYEKGKRDLEATNSTCFMAPLEEPHLHLIQEGIAGRTTASGWKTVVPGYHEQG
jgi:hypothetical protein